MFNITQNFTYSKTRKWSYKNSRTLNNVVVEVDGYLALEGWQASITNGLTKIGPIDELHTFNVEGSIRTPYFKIKAAQKALMLQSPAYKKQRRGFFKKLLVRLSIIPFNLLSAVLSFITFPLYVVYYIVMSIILLFWTLLFKAFVYKIAKTLNIKRS